ncbi:MAG: hypothetical protein IJA84_05735 [Clostridia bacterium]|nr:hypothetical protein [Clostridia bacterium]
MDGKRVNLLLPVSWLCLTVGWTVQTVMILCREPVNEGRAVMTAICALGSLFVSIVWFIRYKRQDPS